MEFICRDIFAILPKEVLVIMVTCSYVHNMRSYMVGETLYHNTVSISVSRSGAYCAYYINETILHIQWSLW